MSIIKKSDIDSIYVEKYIESMEYDYKEWSLEILDSIDGEMFEYRSPKYSDIRYGFGYSNNGAWIDGFLEWSLPYGVYYNPFNKYFWRYHISRRNLKKYKLSELKQKFNNRLCDTIKKSYRESN